MLALARDLLQAFGHWANPRARLPIIGWQDGVTLGRLGRRLPNLEIEIGVSRRNVPELHERFHRRRTA